MTPTEEYGVWTIDHLMLGLNMLQRTFWSENISNSGVKIMHRILVTTFKTAHHKLLLYVCGFP